MTTTASRIEAEPNPRIRRDLRVFMVIEILILLPTGIWLFFATGFAQSVWPWKLTPFNARFIGGFYLGAVVAAAIVAIHGRWAPARVLTTLAFVFTLVVLVVSFVHVDGFVFGRRLTWAWFILYALLPAYTGYALWTHRRLRIEAEPPPTWLRVALAVSAVALGGYGVGLLIAPEPLTRFWPWPVDAFHGRLYSAVPMTPAFIGLMLIRRAAPAELFGAGLTLFAASAWIVVGFVVTDASKHSVEWSSMGTLAWVAAFGVIALLGVLMVATARRRFE